MSDIANEQVCTICEGEFDFELEGGTVGYIGMLPVSFCVTCRAGLFDMVQQCCSLCGDADNDDETLSLQ